MYSMFKGFGRLWLQDSWRGTAGMWTPKACNIVAKTFYNIPKFQTSWFVGSLRLCGLLAPETARFDMKPCLQSESPSGALRSWKLSLMSHMEPEVRTEGASIITNSMVPCSSYIQHWYHVPQIYLKMILLTT